MFKPKGWEAVKCLAVRAKVAVLNPIDFYRGHRCQVWKAVIGTSLEAVNTAITLALLSNPGTGLITVVLRGSTGLGLGSVARMVVKYASRAVQFHPHGGQSDFVWLSARTPHGAYVRRASRNRIDPPWGWN